MTGPVDIKIYGEEYGLSMVKERYQRGKITKETYEDHKPGLSVREVRRPENNDGGAEIFLENGHSIHLSDEKIREILKFSGTSRFKIQRKSWSESPAKIIPLMSKTILPPKFIISVSFSKWIK